MCLLVVASPNSTPRKKDLECASCNNPHGFGFAVITPNGIVTGRGMSSKKVIKQFLEVRKEFPDSYAMFHARYATHGVKNEDNCHPFKVPSEHDTYLAHNGILDINISAGDRRSDTRIFAEDTLPAMGGVSALDDDHVWAMVSKWSIGSKIVIFTLDPNAKETCYIVNETAGFWDNEGMWWSNSTYKPSTWGTYLDTPSKTSMLSLNDSSYDSEADSYEKYACAHCLTVSYEDANPYYCEMCFTCYDCDGMYQDTCLCWTPESDRYAYNKKGKVGYYNDYFGF
jgi:glutamine amidotransferase